MKNRLPRVDTNSIINIAINCFNIEIYEFIAYFSIWRHNTLKFFFLMYSIFWRTAIIWRYKKTFCGYFLSYDYTYQMNQVLNRNIEIFLNFMNKFRSERILKSNKASVCLCFDFVKSNRSLYDHCILRYLPRLTN